MEFQPAMSIYELAVSHNSDSRPASDSKNAADGSFSEFMNGILARPKKLPPPIVNIESATSEIRSAVQDAEAFLNLLWESASTEISISDQNPESFVRSILKPATHAAEELGTTSAAVIAVAALETGWGKHVIQSEDGTSSNNLFGIKATGSRISSAALAHTSEYIDGVKQILIQPFRNYRDAADSVADFATFIKSNPRYENALAQAQDAAAFIDAIHQAGYATDPDYAGKVKAVMTEVEKILVSESTEMSN